MLCQVLSVSSSPLMSVSYAFRTWRFVPFFGLPMLGSPLSTRVYLVSWVTPPVICYAELWDEESKPSSVSRREGTAPHIADLLFACLLVPRRLVQSCVFLGWCRRWGHFQYIFKDRTSVGTQKEAFQNVKASLFCVGFQGGHGDRSSLFLTTYLC